MAAITLNQNAILSALTNMIIYEYNNERLFGSGYSKLVESARKEIALYGDTAIARDVDYIPGFEWDQDSDFMANLLKAFKPTVAEEKIVCDKFRVYPVTIFDVCQKQAFSSEGGFASFTGLVQKMLSESPKVTLEKDYNTFVGTTAYIDSASSEVKVTLDAATKWDAGEVTVGTGEGATKYYVTASENAVKSTQEICRAVQGILNAMKDASRTYNKHGYLRSVDDVKIIWNQDYVEKMMKHGETIMFNPEKLGYKEFFALPGKYFGTPNSAAILKVNVTANTYRVREACEVATATGGDPTHLLAGDYVPAGAVKVLTYTSNGKVNSIAAQWEIGEVYSVNAKVICKIVSELDPLLINISSTESFFNAFNRSTNYYSLLGRNTLRHMDYICGCTLLDA